jgi:hypothetical protein
MNGLPPDTSLRRVGIGGRDVTHGSFNILRDLFDLTIVLTDRPSEVSGTVRTNSGTPDRSATVVMFPAARETWADLWSGPAGLRSIRAGRDGAYEFAVPPGDYFIVAMADADAADITDIASLEAALRVATKVTVADGEKRQLELKTVGAVR